MGVVIIFNKYQLFLMNDIPIVQNVFKTAGAKRVLHILKMSFPPKIDTLKTQKPAFFEL